MKGCKVVQVKVGKILHERTHIIVYSVLPVTGSARSRLEDIAMARRHPNILDYFNSTVPAKRIYRD